MATQRDWKKATRTWYNRLGLWGNTIFHEFKDGTNNGMTGKLDFEPAASIACSPDYLFHHVDVRASWLKTASKDDVDETACHELIHAVLSPLDSCTYKIMDAIPNKQKREAFMDWYKKEQEQVTTRLANSFISADWKE